ncbi:MAG: N-acetylmuramoyl-L-alanine amidase [Actinomycetota bacterium]
MRRFSPRISFVLAAALSLTAASWFPIASGEPFPPTVHTSVEVDGRLLVQGGTRVALRADSQVVARGDSRTATVTECSPLWFDAVGVTWQQTGGGEIDARLRTRGEAGFGQSVEMHADPTHSPDPDTPDSAGAREGTPLLWTGGGRCVRFSLAFDGEAELSNVKVFFVNSSGTADGPGTAPPEPLTAFGLEDAEALANEPKIITRKEWGAQEGLNNCDPYYSDAVRMAFVHHTVTPNGYSKGQADDFVRSIHAYHTRGQGWCDIAYNFLIDRYGRIYEGRKGGIELPVVGAAQQGFNDNAASVALIGNFLHHKVFAGALHALKDLLNWRLDVAHVDPTDRALMKSSGGPNTRYEKGDEVRLRTISGHRNTGFTSCPGTRLYRKLRSVRRQVNDMGLPKIYYPEAKPPSIQQGLQTTKISADGTEILDWSVEIRNANGDLVRTLNATAADLAVFWNGKDEFDTLVPVGPYEATVSAQGVSGAARPAELTIKVKVPS